MYRLYGALLRLAWAAVLPYQTVIALVRGRPRPRLEEKLGRPHDAAAGGIWIHAVSVGEVKLALRLTSRLKERLSRPPVHLTTSTATGRFLAEAARRDTEGGPDAVSELPFDLPGPMTRFLDRVRPRAILIVETEIWPHLFRLCGRRAIPLIVVNGRISPRVYPRYLAVRSLLVRTLAEVRLFGMQSEEDAARIRTLGAPADRVRITGNMKYDLPIPDLDPSEARRRLGLAPAATLFVAGSTAAGEEEPVLLAFAALRRAAGSTRLAIAPRHPEDFARAAEALRSAGLRVQRYSLIAPGGTPDGEPRPARPTYDALLIDVVGVLPEIYAAADLVFVGGSLVPRGGQNLLEPAALGKPVLFGPYVDNFRAAASELCASGGGFVARDGAELAGLAVRLLGDRAASRVAGTMARRVVEANRGAMERTLLMIEEALSAPREAPGILAASR